MLIKPISLCWNNSLLLITLSFDREFYKEMYIFFLVDWGEGNFDIFSKKSVDPPLHFNKKLLTPHLKVTKKCVTLPSLIHSMFHAVEISEHFACEPNMFEYKYISILNVCELELKKKMHTISVGYLRFIAEV